jgi:hypothetical protein
MRYCGAECMGETDFGTFYSQFESQFNAKLSKAGPVSGVSVFESERGRGSGVFWLNFS